MPILFTRRRNMYRCVLLSLIGIVIANEFLLYFFSSLSWPKLKCGDIQHLYSVMLVADPQILGEKSEPWFARLDNDRYLRQSFKLAFHHIQPDLVLFLGDLMDEGSIATEEEYQRYFMRFKNIFLLEEYSLTNKAFYIPGDNDIGGEDELVTEDKVKRFKKFFSSPTEFKLGNLQFIQVDKMQRLVPSVAVDSNTTRVVVSHMPVLGIPSAFAAEVLEKVKPQLILSAHDHKSIHFSADLVSGERTLVEAMFSNTEADSAPSWRFQMSDRTVNEIVVPTCSYRMGVAEMGFGVTLIDKRGVAWCYHILWIPSRFKAITLYILALVVLVVSLARCCLKHRPKSFAYHKY